MGFQAFLSIKHDYLGKYIGKTKLKRKHIRTQEKQIPLLLLVILHKLNSKRKRRKKSSKGSFYSDS